jgi:hypothetical protein
MDQGCVENNVYMINLCAYGDSNLNSMEKCGDIGIVQKFHHQHKS